MSDVSGEAESAGRIPTLSNLLNFIADRDARIALVMAVLLFILVTSLWIGQSYDGDLTVDGLAAMFWLLGKFLLAIAGFVIFFKAIDGTVIPRIIVWFMTSLALCTVVLFWLQAILRTPTPFLIEARCFVNLWTQGCPLGERLPTAADALGGGGVLAEPRLQIGDARDYSRRLDDIYERLAEFQRSAAEPPDELAGVLDQLSALQVPLRALSRDPAPAAETGTDERLDPSEVPNRVNVHFAGAIARDDVATVSRALVDMGWNVQGADQGGERTALSAQLNEVRYFHRQDAAIAQALADDFSQRASWLKRGLLGTVFTPGYERTSPGSLEVWTSN